MRRVIRPCIELKNGVKDDMQHAHVGTGRMMSALTYSGPLWMDTSLAPNINGMHAIPLFPAFANPIAWCCCMPLSPRRDWATCFVMGTGSNFTEGVPIRVPSTQTAANCTSTSPARLTIEQRPGHEPRVGPRMRRGVATEASGHISLDPKPVRSPLRRCRRVRHLFARRHDKERIW